MKENKTALMLNRIFHIVFLTLFGINFICILFHAYSYSDSQRPWIIACFLGFTLIFTGLFLLLQKYEFKPSLKNEAALSDKNTKIIIFCSVGIMLLFQLLMGYFLQMNPITDLDYVSEYALDFAHTGNFDMVQSDYANGDVYLIRYPNNMAIYLFLSFLFRGLYLIFGSIPMYIPVVINAVAINLCVLFTVLIAKKIFGNRKAIYTLISCLLFIPFYTYVPFYYTDSLSMPFAIGSVYLIICSFSSKTKYKKYILASISGALILLGYKMKGSVVIVLGVILVYIVLKYGMKKILCFGLSIVFGFLAVGAIYNAGVDSLNISTKEQQYECEYPVTHWILMGLKGEGHYNYEDSKYTSSFSNKDTKNEGDLKAIKQRIANMTSGEFAYHLLVKAMWTWEDGTYFVSHHIQDPVRKNVLHNYVLKESPHYEMFYNVSSGFQIMLLLLMCLSVLKGCIKPRIDMLTIFKGIIFVVFIFFLIWETRSRYIFNFTPVFLLVAVDGVDFFTKKLIKPIKRRFVRKQ